MSEPTTVYTIGNPPPDWVYEPADASVGLFFEGWYHALEDCADVGLDPEKTVLESTVEGEGANRGIRETIRYRCPCGAQMTVEETIYDPDLPEDRWDAPCCDGTAYAHSPSDPF